MTRESFAALLLFPLGVGALYVPSMLPFAAAAAAAAFLYARRASCAPPRDSHGARLGGAAHRADRARRGAGIALFFQALHRC